MNKKFFIILIIVITLVAVFFALKNDNEFKVENIMIDREERI